MAGLTLKSGGKEKSGWLRSSREVAGLSFCLTDYVFNSNFPNFSFCFYFVNHLPFIVCRSEFMIF